MRLSGRMWKYTGGQNFEVYGSEAEFWMNLAGADQRIGQEVILNELLAQLSRQHEDRPAKMKRDHLHVV